MPATTELLLPASPDDAGRLLPLIAAYHAWENITSSDASRRAALEPLLADPSLGKVWLVLNRGEIAGYVAVTFGWSIEMGGRDAFVDELFLSPAFRGQGLGRMVLANLPALMANEGVLALHLEVARTNAQAKRLYEQAGFASRDGYHLMSLHIA